MFTQNPERPPETFKVKMNSCKRKTKTKQKKKKNLYIFSVITQGNTGVSVFCVLASIVTPVLALVVFYMFVPSPHLNFILAI